MGNVKPLSELTNENIQNGDLILLQVTDGNNSGNVTGFVRSLVYFGDGNQKRLLRIGLGSGFPPAFGSDIGYIDVARRLWNERDSKSLSSYETQHPVTGYEILT